ncbi:lipoyl synthase [Candidatus Marinamargulisbacteria bacterium SCGC AG-439-L15]|nr:lipoyl synthase [Candidatus Marinamargulisbacteria bacterium SCGC AG-439-L15]
MATQQRLPEWFRTTKQKSKATQKLSKILETDVPNSICQEAKCPNRGDCFARGILTFLVLGTVCTRNCAFCSVRHGKPLPPDRSELDQILNAIQRLNLRFVVLTSPNRDDLSDGGASHYAYLVQGIRAAYPKVRVEVLIPDFQGEKSPLQTVIDAGPDVLNHNVETVPSLYTTVRKGSLYKRSLELLKTVKDLSPRTLTKSGLMLGLGEEKEELLDTFKDLAAQGVDMLTLGQYLKPGKDNADVVKYYTPEEFEYYKEKAEMAGIPYVFSGPLVRSSYLAEHVFEDYFERLGA